MDFFTRTAGAAHKMFRHWKDVVGGDGDPGFQKVGMLALAGPDTAPHLRHNAERARTLGAGVELITPDEIRKLVPAMTVDDIALASYEPDSGYADPSSTANALINRARELGATIVQYRGVDAIRTAGARVVGVTSEGATKRRPITTRCSAPLPSTPGCTPTSAGAATASSTRPSSATSSRTSSCTARRRAST